MDKFQMDAIAGDILIVDNCLEHLHLLAELLTARGYQVRQATNGAEAILVANHKPPDLILLDILMPEIDGYEVCRQLKANSLTEAVPIIFMSAKDTIPDKVAAFESGAIDYITKPFEAAEVLVRVQSHLRLHQWHCQMQQQNSELQRENQQLHQQIQAHLTAEATLAALNQELEARLQTDTSELEDRKHQILRLQSKLQEALAQEEALRKVRSQMLGTISHEFRTPLTVISTTTDLLKRLRAATPDEREARYFQRISESVDRMLLVLEDAVILTRVETGETQLELIPMNLTDFCQDLVLQYRLPPASPHRMHFTVSGELPPQVFADPALIQLMLSRLLSNAVRYSPAGGEIQVNLIYQPSQIVIHIQDQGIGIPIEEQPHIFNYFYRAKNADQIPGTPGAGLGLAVVKQAVSLYDGRLEVNSQVGQGTQFTIVLPSFF